MPFRRDQEERDDFVQAGDSAIAGDRATSSVTFLKIMAILAAIGGFLILLYSLRFWSSGQILRIFGVGMLVAGAALLSGFLLGFVFAIPRMGKQKDKDSDSDPEASRMSEKHDPVLFNGNLVEISDWLTKIIVGVGLVELHSIPAKLGKLSYYLAPGLQPAICPGNACSESLICGQAAGLAILVIYSTLGFLMGYVWTTIFFKRDLVDQLKRENRSLHHSIVVKQQLLDTKQQLLATQKFTAEKASPVIDAEVLISANRLDEAMSTIENSLRNDPRDGYALMTKARILKRQALQSGQPKSDREALLKQAVSCIDQAIAILPDEGEPIYNKACYLAQLDPVGLRGDVLANLESAFRMNPALRESAAQDSDLSPMRQVADFVKLIGDDAPSNA